MLLVKLEQEMKVVWTAKRANDPRNQLEGAIDRRRYLPKMPT